MISFLHVTQSIKRPQLGAHGGRMANTVECEGAVRCRGKVVAKCYGCDRAALCAAHKDGLCVACQEGEEPEGGGRGGGAWWRTPMGSARLRLFCVCLG